MADWEHDIANIETKLENAEPGTRVNIDNLNNLSPEEYNKAVNRIVNDMRARNTGVTLDHTDKGTFLEVFRK